MDPCFSRWRGVGLFWARDDGESLAFCSPVVLVMALVLLKEQANLILLTFANGVT